MKPTNQKTPSPPLFVNCKDGQVEICCHYDKLLAPLSLKANPDNPNRHSKAQLKMFAKVFKGVGFRRPVTVSKLTGMIVKGHGAVEAAIELGIEKIPVEFQTYRNYETELADLSADNQLAQLSQNDPNKVKVLLEKFPMEFDKELTGFFKNEIDAMLNKAEIKIVALDVKPAPQMAWALIGIPIEKFAHVQGLLDKLPESTVVHVTANYQTK